MLSRIELKIIFFFSQVNNTKSSFQRKDMNRAKNSHFELKTDVYLHTCLKTHMLKKDIRQNNLNK